MTAFGPHNERITVFLQSIDDTSYAQSRTRTADNRRRAHAFEFFRIILKLTMNKIASAFIKPLVGEMHQSVSEHLKVVEKRHRRAHTASGQDAFAFADTDFPSRNIGRLDRALGRAGGGAHGAKRGVAQASEDAALAALLLAFAPVATACASWLRLAAVFMIAMTFSVSRA